MEAGDLPPGVREAMGKHARGAGLLRDGVRVRTGRTPREVVWTKNKARLYRYEPSREKKHPVPILMVYALINKPYILDLMPGNSLIEFLVDEGFDVYLLDWGVPGEEDADLSFEGYVLDYLGPAAKRVLWTSRAEGYTLFGYCMGGTMAAIHAALFPDAPLKNLVLLTAPVDFSPENTGLLGLWAAEEHLEAENLAESFGIVPGEIIDTGLRMLKPVQNYVGNRASMWEKISRDKPTERWLAMNKWVNDGTPITGAAFERWIVDFYQGNKLARGELDLGGKKVDLSRIGTPLLSIAGKKDHICAVPQAEAVMDLVGSEDKEFFVLDAGHVGLMTGRGAKRGLWPKVSSWLSERSGMAPGESKDQRKRS